MSSRKFPDGPGPSPGESRAQAASAFAPLLCLALVSVGSPLVFYVIRGATGGFLAADDFHFLTGARDQGWDYIFGIGTGEHFYRPVVELWFAGAVEVCGAATGCYHWLHLAAHGVASTLFFALTYYLGRDRFLSSVATIVFMISPGHAEAVLWVSCATEVLSATFVIATVLLCLRAADTQQRGPWLLGAAAALGAVFSHEAGTSVFLLVPVLFWLTGRQGKVRIKDVWPFALVGLLFGVSLVLANFRNPLLTEGAYQLGWHMVRNALDYLVSLYVGPHTATGYITMTLAVAAVALLGPLPARLGVAWMLLAMLPFLGFLSGNTSRYLYAPTMGFGWMVGGLLVALRQWLVQRTGSNRLATVSVITLSAFIVVRFAVFTTEAIQDRLDWFQAYKDYAAAFERSHPDASGRPEVTAPYPSHPNVRVESIQPLLRWTLQSPELIVQVEPKPSGK